MSEDATSRRQFLTNTSRIAGVSTLAGMTLPHVHAAENNTIQVVLVGCGNRGTGAAENALRVQIRADCIGREPLRHRFARHRPQKAARTMSHVEAHAPLAGGGGLGKDEERTASRLRLPSVSASII